MEGRGSEAETAEATSLKLTSHSLVHQSQVYFWLQGLCNIPFSYCPPPPRPLFLELVPLEYGVCRMSASGQGT